MSDIQKQQELDQRSYQYRICIEQLQDDQLSIRKKRRYLEEQEEAFFDL